MSIQFTDSQTRVLNARHHNVLVSAAAGSGKTAVLVERIIRMISEDDPPLDIDRLLIVTFTRAAAAQMRERIAKAISKRLEERPDDRHLQRQETLLHRAQITTIDSFCTFLLRNNFSEVDLDPGFRQMDENEAELLGGDCLRRFLEEQYAAAMRSDTASGPDIVPEGVDATSGPDTAPEGVDAAPKRDDASMRSGTVSESGVGPAGVVDRERFFACVEYFCPGRDDAGLEKLIRRLYEAASSHPYPEAWLEERKKDYAVSSEEELFECDWYRLLLQERLETLRQTQREYQALIAICREPDGPDVYLDTVAAEEKGLYAGLREWDARHLRRSAGTGPVGDAPADIGSEDGIDGSGDGVFRDTAFREPGGCASARGQQGSVGTGGAGSDMEDTAEESYRLRALLLEAAQFSFGRLPAVRKKADKARIDPAKQKRVQDLRGGIKKRIQGLGKGIEEDPFLTLQRMQAAAGPIGTLIDLTLGYMDALRRAKREKNVIDFSDLEHYALQVLIERRPDGTLCLRKAARSYREYYDEVLIDEYQDSNEVQELLLSAITGEPDAGFADAPPGSFDVGAAGAGSYARFMVGDVKQSIYRFRNARPEIFQQKFNTYTVAGEEDGPGRAAGRALTDSVGSTRDKEEPPSVAQNAQKGKILASLEDGSGPMEPAQDARSERISASSADRSRPEGSAQDLQKERIDLDQNFRSRRQVLDAANGVCGMVMRREVGGVEYDEAAALKQGASYPAPVPERDGSDPYQAELLLVDGQKKSSGGNAESTGRAERAGRQDGDDAVPEAEEGDGPEDSADEIADMNSVRKEALAVAQRIRELVGVLPIYDRDTGEQHPARYGDIVILMRSASGRQDAYHEIFEKEGIPLYLEYKGGYFAAEEVRTVLQLLNVIDNPRQDIPLYGVMRGYYGGFSQDEIAQIRALGRDADRSAAGEDAEASEGRLNRADQKAADAALPYEVSGTAASGMTDSGPAVTGTAASGMTDFGPAVSGTAASGMTDSGPAVTGTAAFGTVDSGSAEGEECSCAQQTVGQSCVEGGKLYGSLLLAAGFGGPEKKGSTRAADPTADFAAVSAGDGTDSTIVPAGDRPEKCADCGIRSEKTGSRCGEEERGGSLFSPALREKCARFLTWLNGWRERARSMTVSELIGQLVRSTGYEDYVRALPAGARRAANLRSLLVKADAFERSDRAGLFRFLRYIEEMHTFDVDYGEANVLDEHADVVRLTTIHKSKGLEYPICFICGLGTKYAYKRDTSGTLILDADLGLGTVYTDTALRCSVKTLRQMAVADKIDRDSLGEELRVLYVAMTRAEEKLILTGYTDDAADLLDKIRVKLSSVDYDAPHLPVSLIRGSGNYLNLILESMEMLRAKGREPIRMQTVQVSDLRLAQLEDQLVMDRLRSALILTEQGDLSDLPSPEIARQLERNFAYRYPYENLAGLYTKTTVTELKRAAMVDSGLFGETGEVPAEMYPEEAYRDFDPGEPGDIPNEMYPEKAYRDFDPGEPGGAGYHDTGKPEEIAAASGGAVREEIPEPAADALPVPEFAEEHRDLGKDFGAASASAGGAASDIAASQPSGVAVSAMADERPVPRFAMEEELREKGDTGASAGAGRAGVPQAAESFTGTGRAGVPQAGILTGAARGTAVHRMCERIDYRVWNEPSRVTARMFEDRVAALLGTGEIPPAYAAVLKPRTFLPFLHSDIASRMARADAKGLLSREQPFVLGIAANRLNPQFPEEETILIQGIIDAFFIEEDEEAAGAGTENAASIRSDGADSASAGGPRTAAGTNPPLRPDGAGTASAAVAGTGAAASIRSDGAVAGLLGNVSDLSTAGAGEAGNVSEAGVGAFDDREERYCAETGRHIVLVDYKTDRVKTGQELIDRYRVQVDYYTEALERMFGLPVTERILYSFALQEEIHVCPVE